MPCGSEPLRAAVVLMAYGSPERLADVPAYYADIRGGKPIRPELLDDLVERYRRLDIESGSPLNAVTEETRATLEAELGVPVFTGMKHWTPRIAEAAEAALAAGARTVAGLVLAPHYSRLSIAGYRAQLEEALAGRAELAFVESWHDDDGLVDFLAARVRGTDAHIVVTDHLEIRWDIDTEAQEKAHELGMGLDRIEMPNADPAFVRVLAGLVRRRLPLPSSAG